MLQSGEGGARTDITIPAPQKRLLKRVRALGKPVVLVLFNGRPLALTDVIDDCDAIVGGVVPRYGWWAFGSRRALWNGQSERQAHGELPT